MVPSVSPAVGLAVAIAIIGWIATIRAISTSSLRPVHKRWLLIPSWIPWIALALGAPILSGFLPLAEAINIGGAMTAGLVVSVVVVGRQTTRR